MKEAASEQSSSSLGAVQISVTAATPMVEDAQKSFLSDTIQEEDEESEPEVQPAPPAKGDRKRTSELEQGVAEAVDEILEEARKETSNKQRPNQPPPLPPAPVPASTPPKDDDELPPPPPPEEDNKFDAQFEANFEAHFEANFDNAFGSEPPPPQVVGGRASIPEELEPDQLARLQNLKESDA